MPRVESLRAWLLANGTSWCWQGFAGWSCPLLPLLICPPKRRQLCDLIAEGGIMSQSANSSLLRDGIDAGPEGDWAAGRSILAYGVPIGVRTNKPEFLDRILDYAPPLWQPASNGRVERLFSFRVSSS